MNPVRVAPNGVPAFDVRVARRSAEPEVQDKVGHDPMNVVPVAPTVGLRAATIESPAAGRIHGEKADLRAAAAPLARGARREAGTRLARAGQRADSPALADRRDTGRPRARAVRHAGQDLLAEADRLDPEMPRVVPPVVLA